MSHNRHFLRLPLLPLLRIFLQSHIIISIIFRSQIIIIIGIRKDNNSFKSVINYLFAVISRDIFAIINIVIEFSSYY